MDLTLGAADLDDDFVFRVAQRFNLRRCQCLTMSVDRSDRDEHDDESGGSPHGHSSVGVTITYTQERLPRGPFWR